MVTPFAVRPEEVLQEINATDEEGVPLFRTISTRVASTIIDVSALTEAQNNAWSSGADPLSFLDPGDIGVVRHQKDMVPPEVAPRLKAWLKEQGIDGGHSIGEPGASPSLLTCLGALYHSDASHFSDSVFAIVWLDEDAGWDLHFPQTNTRVELVLGTVVVFDSCLPHGVVKRGKDVFNSNDFLDHSNSGLVSFDLDVCNETVAKFMGISTVCVDDIPQSKVVNAFDFGRFFHDIDRNTGAWMVTDRAQNDLDFDLKAHFEKKPRARP